MKKTKRFGPKWSPASLADPRCPKCGGSGWLRQNLPFWHRDFGKLVRCGCIARRAVGK